MFYPQTYSYNDEHLIYGSNHFAQSFTVSKSKLDSISLKLRRVGNPSQGLTVSIYDSLTNNRLASASKSASQISSVSSWVDFDFDDIKVYKNGAMWEKEYDGIGVADDSLDFLFKTFDTRGQVDQEWTHCSGFGETIFSDDICYAQSFKPSTSKISKIGLALGRWGNPPNLIVSIVRLLDGEELTKISIPSEDVPEEGWLEVDCDDVNVNVGQTYYIVCRTNGGDDNSNNKYAWWFGFNDNNQHPSYTRGERWSSFESGRYYVVCKTSGGNSNNCYAWSVQSHDNTYYNGACYESQNNGYDWEEKIFDDMFFRLNEKDNGDKLDQYQHIFSGSGHIVYSDMWSAQSFKPTGKNLSKVRLLLFSNMPSQKKITVSIRKSLDGNDLTKVSKPGSEFYYFNGYPHWYEFDFEDIELNVGETYYIVCRSTEAISSSNYAWGEMMSRSSDSYTQGTAYYCHDGDKNWVIDNDFGTTDHCFETYYRESSESHSHARTSRLYPLFKILDFFPFLQQIINNLLLVMNT